MKNITQLLTALVFGSLLIFASCGGGKDDPKVDPADAIGEELATIAGSPSSVTLDGESRSEWSSTTFTFTYDKETNTGTVVVADAPTNDGADAVWGSGGTYSLNDDGTAATLNGTEISISGTKLTFDVAEGSGRAAVFYGTWVFSF
ncbi:MAG: hypothetical protein ABJG41_17500 [Cyclobacteriaceae bacterium]